jgi:glycosyltransferase involved in cell wall biosynthesis
MRIAIYGDMFVEWGGGIDFLRILLRGLNALPNAENNKLFLVIPIKKISPFSYLKYYIKKSFNALPLKKKYVAALPKPLNLKHIEAVLQKEARLELIIIDYAPEELANVLAPYQLDIILPCFHPIPNQFPIPWLGYLYDFQHKYLPHFFTKTEIAARDLAFAQMVSSAPAIIVNARAVRKDAIEFLGANPQKVFALPFCPLYGQEMLEGNLDKFKLPESFFLISNQFWKHKDHATAFKAMKEFYALGSNQHIHLVCTGELIDYRFPEYANELRQLLKQLGIEKQVHLLGYISKQEQVLLMQKAIAVLQPTLFEGGPGGGVVYEALARNKYVVLSDIPVNQEIEDERCTFFEPGNPIDFAKKLAQTVKKEKLDQQINLQLQQQQTQQLAAKLNEAINFAQENFKNISV